MKAAVTLLFVWKILLSGYLSKAVSISGMRTNEVESGKNEEEASISCQCGKLSNIQEVKMDVNEAIKFFEQGVLHLQDLSSLKYYRMFMNGHAWICSNCEVNYVLCVGDPSNFEEYSCTKHYAYFGLYSNDTSDPLPENKTLPGSNNRTLKVIKRSIDQYPVDVKIPIGGLRNARHQRDMEGCHYPTSLETSELHCKIYPRSVKCRQRCAFGYTLISTTEVQRECKMKDNIWRPAAFQECQPFVDCGLTLVSGGVYTCSTPVVRKGPRCKVKCNRYEDKMSRKERMYSCNIKGRWSPKLPFCVVKGSGLILVRRPKYF